MDGTILALLLVIMILIFGTRIFSLNPYFVIYIIVSFLTIFQVSSKLMPMGQARAAIYAIGATLLAIFFGYRWFSNSKNSSESWPPTINMCPDYLTFVPNIPQTLSSSINGGACVDKLGVTRGNLEKTYQSDISNNALTNNKLFRYTSADVKATAETDTATTQAICDACRLAGVTWEGVYDGDSCVGIARALAAQQAQSQCAS
jgi:hypothetical protein